MEEKRIAKNLQLDEGVGHSSAHMELHDTGGDVDTRWQLRNDPGATDWQPVEYARPNRSESNWILPSLVGLVLISVAGYMVYIGLNRISGSDILSISSNPVEESANGAAADNQSEAVVSAVEQQATNTPIPTEEPTATALPTEIPTAEPTVALIEQEVATITNQYGVNARLEPNTAGEVLRILEEGETVVVLDEQEAPDIEGNWLQVRTSEDAIVWISSQFVDIETQVVAGEPSTASSTTPDLDVRVTISSPAGLNARAEPDSASDIVALLPNNTSYQAVSQSADGQWIEVDIEGGSTAWIFLQLVIPDADLATLPTFSPNGSEDDTAVAEPTDIAEEESAVAAPTVEPTPEATEVVTETVDAPATEVSETSPITSTDAITDSTTIAPPTEVVTDTVASEDGNEDAGEDSSDEVSAGPPITTGFVISVTSEFGVNARTTTSVDADVVVILEDGTTPPLRGRTEDSSWLQVVLDDGTLAWVFAQAVTAPENLDEIPVFEPPAVGEPAEVLENSGAVADENATSDESTDNEPAAEEATPDETAADDETATDDTATGTDEAASTEDTGSSVTATVTSFLGAKARPAPTTEQEETETVPFDETLTVVGRSTDGEWIQVQLFEEELAWILVNRVNVSVPVDELPVTE